MYTALHPSSKAKTTALPEWSGVDLGVYRIVCTTKISNCTVLLSRVRLGLPSYHYSLLRVTVSLCCAARVSKLQIFIGHSRCPWTGRPRRSLVLILAVRGRNDPGVASFRQGMHKFSHDKEYSHEDSCLLAKQSTMPLQVVFASSLSQ